MDKKPIIIISAVNITEGGPLTVLKDCISTLNSFFVNNYSVIVIVHKKDLFLKDAFDHIKFIEFPKSKKSWLYRLYFEYYYFKIISKRINPYLWISLHDTSPILVSSVIQCVYCHNAGMFYKASLSDILYDKTMVLFSLFYKFLYRFNIHRNKYIIVQQDWMRQAFHTQYGIALSRIIVAYPQIFDSAKYIEPSSFEPSINKDKTSFIYASFPRIFKNFEIIICPCKILIKKGITNFEVNLTLNGHENLYSQKIQQLSLDISQIKFIGLLSKNDLEKQYANSDVLIFPSKLETWGLPITEFKSLNKTLLLADLKYARETAGNYDKVSFFEPNNPHMLATLMESAIVHGPPSTWQGSTANVPDMPFTKSWKSLFDYILSH